MAIPTRLQILSLYRDILRHARLFKDYNYRQYVVRVAREDFHKHAHDQDPATIESLWTRAVKEAGVVRRQSLLSQIYAKGTSILDLEHGRFDRPGGAGESDEKANKQAASQ